MPTEKTRTFCPCSRVLNRTGKGLNLEFKSSTKIIAFADDLLLLKRGKSVREFENIANKKLKKISIRAREIKIRFNDKNRKIC